MNYPDKHAVQKLWREYDIPTNLRAHMRAVCSVAMQIGRAHTTVGNTVDLELLKAAALLHDLDKMETLQRGVHGERVREILETEGYPDVARVASHHVLENILAGNLKTLEEKILFYADKRVRHTRIVSLQERFEDLLKRYATFPGAQRRILSCKPEVEKLEQELFAPIPLDPEGIKEGEDG